jgi:predicted nucleic acid-binding protein
LDEALALDASVVVKWFKEGERMEGEALALRDGILGGRVSALTSEWLLLEVVRAMVKVGFPREKIDGAFSALKEMVSLGFIEAVPVGEVMDEAKEIEVALSLFASDSVYLATAMKRNATLITEDRHLLRREVRDYAKEGGIGILSLGEMK